MKNSLSTPLRIDELPIDEGGGLIGISLCPGKKNLEWQWDRDLEIDLQAIAAWGACAVVSLVEDEELVFLSVPSLGRRIAELGMTWLHLPIRDGDIPDSHFAMEWRSRGPEIHRRLDEGKRILIHCRGGKGRSGLVAALILLERGWDPALAIRHVRATRCGAIETGAQESYILRAFR